MPTLLQHAQEEVCPITAVLHSSLRRKFSMAPAKGLPMWDYWHCQDNCESAMSAAVMVCKFNCLTSGAVWSSVPLLNSQFIVKDSQDGQVIQSNTRSILRNAFNTSAAIIVYPHSVNYLSSTMDLTAQMLVLETKQLWNSTINFINSFSNNWFLLKNGTP